MPSRHRLWPLHQGCCLPLLALGALSPRRASSGGCTATAMPGHHHHHHRRLRVLVDMDGVLADFEGGFLKKFQARYPDQPYVPLEDRRGFWVSEQYERLQPGLSEKAISIWESKNFFIELDPLPGAVEAVKQMAKLKETDVFICTSPIKKYRYCPYEKELSRAPAGSTSSSRPATTSTWSSQLLFGGSTRGPMIGSPSWTASAFRRAGLVPTAASPGGPLVNLGQWVPSGNAEKGVQFQTWKPRVDLAGSKQEAMRKPRPKTCGLSLC
ncbi:5'(3')-deoxyribonucleotidase, mitochondrial isoform X3 [Tiliqua scincoides]|uniref:5'(3')-deoxyribonucleotidase, mitochondrial isoform X3 n=1 Tax=Tiliqua scincoides TaxID=71010 RepID=UPI0034618F42